MSDIATIEALINANVDNYPNKAFQNNTMKTILLMMLNVISGGVVTSGGIYVMTSSNFTTSVDCPIPTLNGVSLQIMWVDVPRNLVKGVDWTDYAGGGFTISTVANPGFDATSNSYTFYVFIKAN